MQWIRIDNKQEPSTIPDLRIGKNARINKAILLCDTHGDYCLAEFRKEFKTKPGYFFPRIYGHHDREFTHFCELEPPAHAPSR